MEEPRSSRRVCDLKAFEKYYGQNCRGVLALCKRLAGPDEGEDIASETWVKAYRAFPEADPKCNSWVYRIAVRVYVDSMRGSKGRVVALLDGDLPDAGFVEQTNDAFRVDQILYDLDPETRAMVLLRTEGATYRAIAEVLPLSESGIRSRVHRALRQLAQFVKQEAEKDEALLRDRSVNHPESTPRDETSSAPWGPRSRLTRRNE